MRSFKELIKVTQLPSLSFCPFMLKSERVLLSSVFTFVTIDNCLVHSCLVYEKCDTGANQTYHV